MKDAVLALGMGGPDSLDAIEPFLKNLLSDREIINFHMGDFLQGIIAAKIARSRSEKVKPNYRHMGGGSPQLRHTEALLKQVAPKYEQYTGRQLDTYTGMCYWEPYIEQAAAEINKQEYGRIHLFPMYPQYSVTTSGVCFNRYNKAVAYDPPRGKIVRINQFHMNKAYLEAIAGRIRAAAAKLGKTSGEIHLFISAHSLPQSVADAGDPYVHQIREQADALVQMVRPASHSLAFQSKLGRMKWLEPSAVNEIKAVAKSGATDVVVHAISFINDHIETLVELDIELAEDAKALGLNMVRTESFNDAGCFADIVAKLLADVYL